MAIDMINEAELIKQINEANLPIKQVTRDNTDFDGLTEADHNGHNTMVWLRSVPGKGFANDVQLYYTRVDLVEALDGKTIRSATADTLTPSGLLTLLNNQFRTFLDLDDVEPFTIPVLAEGESAQITIEARDYNLIWFNSAEVTLFHGRAYLDVVVSSTALNILNHPISEKTRMSARMLTWDRDFTSIKEALAIDSKTGSFVDGVQVLRACGDLGIPAWNLSRISDYPTSQVADANPKFERVVIQRSVSSSGMVGDVYLHYNTLSTLPADA